MYKLVLISINFIKPYSIAYILPRKKTNIININYHRMRFSHQEANQLILHKGDKSISQVSHNLGAEDLVTDTTAFQGRNSWVLKIKKAVAPPRSWPQTTTSHAKSISGFRQRTKILLHISGPQGKYWISLPIYTGEWSTSYICFFKLFYWGILISFDHLIYYTT